MEIFLSKQCESLTGTLGRGFGYYIRSTKKRRYFSQRSKHSVPPDGHWCFILACAILAQNKLHIADIRVRRGELVEALWEAGLKKLAESVRENPDPLRAVLTADDILKFKNTFGL